MNLTSCNRVVLNLGQPNRSVYHVTCKLEGYTYVGVGRTKKDAKTDAAFKVLEDLNALDDEYYDDEGNDIFDYDYTCGKKDVAICLSMI